MERPATTTRYQAVEAALTALDQLRDRVTAQMSSVLLGAAFDHRSAGRLQVARLELEGTALLAAAHHLAG